MSRNKYVFFGILLLLWTGCDTKGHDESNQEAIATDAIPRRAVPIPAPGKLLDPDSLARPKTVPILRKPKAVPARNNVFVAKPPTILPVLDNITIITPGVNGVPLPEAVTVHEEVTTISHPRPTPASPLAMKPEAITDIQYLSVSQGLKDPWVECIMEDGRGNLWINNGDYLSRYDGQQFVHFVTKDAFNLDDIRCMMEDSRGNLWLAGGGGISRYDGKCSTHYTFKGGGYVNSMMEDQDGKIWFGTFSGVVRYDPSANDDQARFVRYTTALGLVSDAVHSILESRKGGLWFGGSHGVCLYDGKHFTNYPIEPGLNDDTDRLTVRTMIEDSQGILWLGTDVGLIRFDPSANAGRGSFANINIKVDRIAGLTEDDRGNIWVAGYHDGIFCLLHDGTGIGARYVRYTQKEGLHGNYFHTMIKDSHGNLWIGGQNGGAIRINHRNPIRYYNQENGLRGNDVISIFEDGQGPIWFGLSESIGAIKYDTAAGGTFTNYGPAEGLDAASITSIMEDRRGNLWLGSWIGNAQFGASRLNRSKKHNQSSPSLFDQESFTYFSVETGLQEHSVLSMLQDSRGNLWLGHFPDVTYHEPDYVSGGPGRFIYYPLSGGRRAGGTSDFLEDRMGKLWISTSRNGVYKLDLNLPISKEDLTKVQYDIQGQLYTNYTIDDGLSDNGVNDIIEDSSGALWFATDKGLSRFDPSEEQFYTYRAEDGLYGENLKAMAEDAQNRLWILSPSGINVVVSDQSSASAASGTADYQFFAFSEGDGFITSDAGFKNILVTRENQLWWATGDGVASLDLNNFELPAIAPKINLNAIEFEQTYLDFASFQDVDYIKSSPLMERLTATFDSVAAFSNYPLNLVLPYDLNHLTFQFSAIDWSAPHQLQYSYLMEGMDKIWSERSSETKADYRNLTPGTYIFKVKAIGAAKKWSEVFEYPFKVRPPWWLTWWAYGLYGLIFISIIFYLDRFQRKRLLEKARAEARDKELAQAREIEKAYTELKATQSQLIQSEKMASLGELTAGIAHEIQNPLNFVNNFSEVNRELIAELKEEVEKGDWEEIKAIAEDIEGNEEKIHHHGQRASSIVKGMLEHSRTGDGVREPMDINTLLDEYVRLAYHGLRAKDKSFNADFKMELDPSLPKIKVVPQDIGRVFLNLINNAFFAVNQKAARYSESKVETGAANNEYKPEVIVSTKHVPLSEGVQGEEKIEIRVSDNGPGIPEEIRDKIFQPFFTTKPTGSGTGLGLSLSYDIVKAHGGSIEVKSNMYEGTEFEISLPVNTIL